MRLIKACVRIATLTVAAAAVFRAPADTFTWTNTAPDFWSNAGNWSPNQVPGPGDVAIITLANADVTADTQIVVAGLTLGGSSGSAALTVPGGTSLAIQNGGSVSAHGILNLNGGLLSGGGTLNIAGQFNWPMGRCDANSVLSIGSSGRMTINGGVLVEMSGVITNAGTIVLDADNSVLRLIEYAVYGGGAGVLVNAPGGVVDIQGDAGIDTYTDGSGLGNAAFINQGMVKKSAGSGVSVIGNPQFSIPFTNAGTVLAMTGTINLTGQSEGSGVYTADLGASLEFNGETNVLDATATINGAGTLSVASGTFLANATLGTANVVFAQGLWGGTNCTVTGSMTWLGGRFLPGSVLSIATNASLNITGNTNGEYDFSGIMTNYGTVRLQSQNLRLISYNPYGGGYGLLVNQPGGLIDLQADVGIDYYYDVSGIGYPTFINNGVLQKSGGTGLSTIGNASFPGTITSVGTIHAMTGTINLNSPGEASGKFTADAGADIMFTSIADFIVDTNSVMDGAGTISINMASASALRLNGLLATKNCSLLGGILSGTNGVIASAVTWSGGRFGADGILTLATNCILTSMISGYADMGGILTNYGTIQLTAGDLRLVSYLGYGGGFGILVNAPGSLLDLQGDFNIDYLNDSGLLGFPVFINQGTLRKSAGAGGMTSVTTTAQFYNSGVVDVQQGWLNLASGGTNDGQFIAETGAILQLGSSFTVGPNGSVSGAGTNILSSGTTYWNGRSVGASNLVLEAGTALVCSNALFGGRLIWNNATISGNLTIATNGTLVQVGGGYGSTVYGIITNAGTILFQSGNADIIFDGTFGGGQIYNLPTGLIDFTGYVWLHVGNGAGQQVVNQGTVHNSYPFFPNIIYLPVYNSGTVDAAGSGFQLSGGGAGAGVFSAETGSVLQFIALSYALTNGTQLAGGGYIEGLMSLTGGITGSNGSISEATLVCTNAILQGNLGISDTSVSGPITVATNGTLVVGAYGSDYYNIYDYGVLTNAGTILLQGSAEFILDGTQGGGKLYNLPGALVDNQGNVMVGPYSANGELVANYGTIRNSGGTTNAIVPQFLNLGTLDLQHGTVSLAQNYSLTGGNLNFGISSLTDFGRLNIGGGAALLDGTLSANLVNGFQPIAGNTFPVINYASESGVFTATNLPLRMAWQTNYAAASGFALTVLNVAPTLTLPANHSVDELTLLSVGASSTDPDLPPQTLTFSLVNPPTGMSIDPALGTITWTPAQTQSPSTNTIVVSVTDNGTPRLTTTGSFQVNVIEINSAPSLGVITAKSVNELSQLTVNNAAAESNIHATLAYSLVNPPAGAAINSSGVITWTPAQTQSPGVYSLTTVVTNTDIYDLVNPHLYATNTISVSVIEVNTAPTLFVIPTQTVNELTPLSVTNTAAESNIHATLGYSLVNPPSGMSINSSGVINWTPAQTQSPSTNTITTIVTNTDTFDLVNPHLSTTNSFTVIVKEVNVTPVLGVIPNQTVNELTLLTVTNAATDSNIHATFAYSLVNPPAGAAIDANGVITWTPAQTQSPSTNVFTTIVTNTDTFDAVNPHLSATNSFTVVVKEMNVAPVLGSISAQSVNELSQLTVSNPATESNIHATLAYSLVNAPAGASINSSGLITWTPTQAQSPGSYTITTVVTNTDTFDTVTPHLNATNSFTVTVVEVNNAPVLGSVPDQNVNELTQLSINNAASEANIHSTLSYALVNPPSGATISASGQITWTPTQAQSPGTYTITTVVTATDSLDTVHTVLTATNSFKVNVVEVNVAPVLATIPTQTVNDLALLTVNNAATDSDIHASLAYALVNPPAGASINASGVITWTPTKAQGPSTNLITTVVTDTDSFDSTHTQLTATNGFLVIVYAPTLHALSNVTVNAGQVVNFTASATDNDPSRTLAFSLSNAPAGAVIGSASGVFNWRVPVAFAGVTTNLQVTVTDNSSPTLSDSRTFQISVNPLTPITLGSSAYSHGSFQTLVTGFAGPDYILQAENTLGSGVWTNVVTNTPVSFPAVLLDTNAIAFPHRSYRVLLGP